MLLRFGSGGSWSLRDCGKPQKGDKAMPEGPVNDLPEGAEAAPQDFQDAVQQADRERLEKILDKAASDSGWKQQLLDDPEAALAAIGANDPPELGEVAGQGHWRTKWVYRWRWWGGWRWYHWNW
jgi:hypothetical protein